MRLWGLGVGRRDEVGGRDFFGLVEFLREGRKD
jgi:hypothetical protein